MYGCALYITQSTGVKHLVNRVVPSVDAIFLLQSHTHTRRHTCFTTVCTNCDTTSKHSIVALNRWGIGVVLWCVKQDGLGFELLVSFPFVYCSGSLTVWYLCTIRGCITAIVLLHVLCLSSVLRVCEMCMHYSHMHFMLQDDSFNESLCICVSVTPDQLQQSECMPCKCISYCFKVFITHCLCHIQLYTAVLGLW